MPEAIGLCGRVNVIPRYFFMKKSTAQSLDGFKPVRLPFYSFPGPDRRSCVTIITLVATWTLETSVQYCSIGVLIDWVIALPEVIDLRHTERHFSSRGRHRPTILCAS